MSSLARFALAPGSAILAIVACTDVAPDFSCERDEACVLGGEHGYCEPSGHCSFDEADCETKRRYGDDAGDLARTCVPPWALHVGGPFDETYPSLALDRAGQLHVVTSFADRVVLGDDELASKGGTDVLHAELSARTGRVNRIESFGGDGNDVPTGLRRWGQDAVVLSAVFGAEARALGGNVPENGSLVTRRGEGSWAAPLPMETGEARALQVQGIAVDGTGAIFVTGDAYGAPLDLGGGVALDGVPIGFGGFVASFTGEGAPRTAYPVYLEQGASAACSSITTDGDSRFAATCTGFLPNEAGEIDFEVGYPLLVVGSLADGFPIPFAALSPTSAITFVSFALDGSLIVGGYFEDAAYLPADLTTGEDVLLTAVGQADGFIAQLTVEIGAEAVAFATAGYAQLGGADAGIFPLAFEPGEDGSFHVAGAYYGTVEPFGPSAGRLDAFTLSVDLEGNVSSAKRYGGVLDDVASTLAVDATGEVFVGGTFQDEIELDGVTLRAAGGIDVFVTRVDPSAAP